MKHPFDRTDRLVALGIFAGVATWAFVWAHPYPHPDLWPFLTAVGPYVSLAFFGISGRLFLGVFAALAYLLMRGVWIANRADDDEAPDRFLHARLAPLLGAVMFTCFPHAWRMGQFLSPAFLQLVLVAFAFLLWLCGRRSDGLYLRIGAYLIFGLVAGTNPLGIVPWFLVGLSDAILWWRLGSVFEVGEDDEVSDSRRKVQTALFASSLAAFVGFGIGVWLLAQFALLGEGPSSLGHALLLWWLTWTGVAVRSVTTPAIFTLLFATALAVLGVSAGRRIRSLSVIGPLACDLSVVALSAIALLFLCRAIDRPERLSLGVIGEYVSFVATDAGDARFLFSDGRLDDALKMEFALRGRDVCVLDVMSRPDRNAAERLRKAAPVPSDRPVFERGGAEVFRFWARECPARLDAAAWQLGCGELRRLGTVRQRTHGTVIRSEAASRAETAATADRRLAEWTKGVVALADSRRTYRSLFGGIDDRVSARFDAVLWRTARMADERAGRLDEVRDLDGAAKERESVRRLDDRNVSLKVQRETVERMMATDKVILTPKEALDVALVRADFALARPYAVKVLEERPDDSSANFAMAMAKMEARDYAGAVPHFERALRKNPREPASLNNLAIAHAMLGDFKKALDYSRRAAEILPNSSAVLQTQTEIRRRMKAAAVGANAENTEKGK